MLPNYPTYLSQPFAAGGDKAAIPDSAGGPGRASLAEGFPILTQTPLTAGGIPPSRLDFNGILHLLSQFAFWQQSGGMTRWSANLNYAAPALVWGSDNKLYACLTPSGPEVPGVGAKDPADPAHKSWWMDYEATVLSKVEAGIPKGQVAAYYKVGFGGSDGRRPIFWGETAPDEGYVLCDGGSDGAGGSVPDLRDRMIVGSGRSYAAGAAGGNANHGHSLSGSVGYTTLSEAQLASHRHTFGSQDSPAPAGSHLGVVTTGNNGGNNTNYTGSSQSHTHSLSASTNSAPNMPPYYALAYLVKL